MDGVGARLGRSSARYAPTTVFTGPVRRWKKKWIQGTPPSSGNNHSRNTANGGVNGSNISHLLLFKWIPITASQNNNDSSSKDDVVSVEEPPKRKFKYIPVLIFLILLLYGLKILCALCVYMYILAITFKYLVSRTYRPEYSKLTMCITVLYITVNILQYSAI